MYKSNQVRWEWKRFSELSPIELYQIIQARESVFVVEQKINYVDCDDKDLIAYHLLGYLNHTLVAYLRAFAPGLKYPQAASIGRVLTLFQFRGQGLGKELLQQGIEHSSNTFGNVDIQISAQTYLAKFYQHFGFQIVGAQYQEEGLPHFQMIKKTNT